VRQWKFRPGTRNGEPVAVFFPLVMNFKPDGSAEAVLTAGGTIGPAPAPRPLLTTVILVRDAESAPAPPDDPLLTAEGRQRGERLARMFAGTSITAIYTTPFAWSRATAAPLAAAMALAPVEVPVTPTYASDIVARVQEHRDGTFVVVGQPGTTRDVLRAFGVSHTPEIPDTAYDNLFILTYGPSIEPRLLALKY
jgi:phosphohistidine phosphatase SixA